MRSWLAAPHTLSLASSKQSCTYFTALSDTGRSERSKWHKDCTLCVDAEDLANSSCAIMSRHSVTYLSLQGEIFAQSHFQARQCLSCPEPGSAVWFAWFISESTQNENKVSGKWKEEAGALYSLDSGYAPESTPFHLQALLISGSHIVTTWQIRFLETLQFLL